MRSYWFRVGIKFNDCCLYKRKGTDIETQMQRTHTGRRPLKMKAETGVMPLQAKDPKNGQQAQKLGERQTLPRGLKKNPSC